MGREHSGFQMRRLTSHSVDSLKSFWPTPSHVYDLNTSLSKRHWGMSKMRWHHRPMLHTKDALVLLLVTDIQGRGQQKLQPAIYQRQCPNWVLFPNPALKPASSGICYLFLGIFQKSWSLYYHVFKWHKFIQGANLLSAYTWECVGLAEDLFKLIVGPGCQDMFSTEVKSGLSKEQMYWSPVLSSTGAVSPVWSMAFFLKKPF